MSGAHENAAGRRRGIGDPGDGLTVSSLFVHGSCMATKTITIDLEAYEALRRRKEKGESFSDVIKRHFAGGVTGRELGVLLERFELADDTLESLDALIEDRRKHPARVAEI